MRPMCLRYIPSTCHKAHHVVQSQSSVQGVITARYEGIVLEGPFGTTHNPVNIDKLERRWRRIASDHNIDVDDKASTRPACVHFHNLSHE